MYQSLVNFAAWLSIPKSSHCQDTMEIFWDCKTNGQILNHGESIMLSALLWLLAFQVGRPFPNDISIMQWVANLSKEDSILPTLKASEERECGVKCLA